VKESEFPCRGCGGQGVHSLRCRTLRLRPGWYERSWFPEDPHERARGLGARPPAVYGGRTPHERASYLLTPAKDLHGRKPVVSPSRLRPGPT